MRPLEQGAEMLVQVPSDFTTPKRCLIGPNLPGSVLGSSAIVGFPSFLAGGMPGCAWGNFHLQAPLENLIFLPKEIIESCPRWRKFRK